MGDIATNPADTNRIREYYEQLYTHEFTNLDKMDQFLQKCKLLQFTQYKIDNLNNPITLKDTEFVILILPKEQFPGQMVSLKNTTKCLKDN